MERFAALYDRIDQTTSTNEKVRAIAEYFAEAPAGDAAWALYFLTGRRIKRLVKSRDLRAWTIARTGIEPWLMEECYSVVGDGAETVSLLLDREDLPPVAVQVVQEELPFARGQSVETGSAALAEWVEGRLMLLPTLDSAGQMRALFAWWGALRGTELFLFNKLLTGELRVGVSQQLVVRALSMFSGLDEATIAHRLTGEWRPSAMWFERLVAPGAEEKNPTPRPYPFFLASPLTDGPDVLSEISEWIIEYKYDGIRAQLIRRGGQVSIWSRGNEVLTDRFPEVRDAAAHLPDGIVLDGELVAQEAGEVRPFAMLQRRIGRLAVTPRILAEAPAAFVAFDLLEEGCVDVRVRPLVERRQRLEAVLGMAGDRVKGRLVLSPRLEAPDWAAIAAVRVRSRELNVEGVMLKRLSSVYQVGRRRGDWWKWKIEPYSIDAVLVYAQPGHGRRANLLTDYTFAVWAEMPEGGRELTPVAKAYSGLNAKEVAELDRWIRQHTIERFGPARAVKPVQVFELHFEGIAESERHRSGVALRFPRMARWRRDKRAEDAETLGRVKELLRAAH